MKRDARDANSESSADQLTLLENVFKDGEDKATAKRSRTIESYIDRHRIHHRDSLPESRALKLRKTKSQFTKLTQRDMNSNSDISASHALNSIASPNQRALTVGMNNELEVKATSMLKRVGLGLVTVSDLSLEMREVKEERRKKKEKKKERKKKEVVVRVSGKATPKKIGGWFNFEILRKDIFAVGFTAEQARFEDFIAKIFNTSLSLFKNLEKTSVRNTLL